MSKRCVVLFLCSFLIFSILSANVYAEMTYGAEINFGRYEQDGYTTNGAEPVTWIVIDTDSDNDTMMLISKYCLDVIPYHDNKNQTSWKNSKVRNWLNKSFYQSAFNPDEKAMIVDTKVSNSMDHVFLLNANQIKTFLDTELCTGTAYAKKQGLYVAKDTGDSSWWVRTDSTSSHASFVGAHGKIYTKNNPPTTKDNGVRPVIILRKSTLIASRICAVDNLKLNGFASVDGWGTVEVTSCQRVDRLGFYPTGSYKVASETWYESGQEAEFLMLKVNITNDDTRRRDIIGDGENVSVTVIFDDTYQFAGWKYQYNWENQTAMGSWNAALPGDEGKQNTNYVINKADNFSILPGETGHYCFGCTLPNSVIESDAPLKMVINISGYEMIYVIR